jgi:hypothetical protein
MKLVLNALAVILLIVASMYFLVSDQLPGFLPGHEAGVTRTHVKHGVVSGVVGIAPIVAGSWMGRK